MEAVRRLHVDLNEAVSNLPKTCGKLVATQEAEFLVAYRSHMMRLQEEMQTLKDKISDSEKRMAENSVIARMEHQKAWFQSESFHLSGVVSSRRRQENILLKRKEKLGKTLCCASQFNSHATEPSQEAIEVIDTRTQA